MEVIKRNKRIRELCDSISENIFEIRECIHLIDSDDETDSLFQIDYINDCMIDIEESIVELQSKFATFDEKEYVDIVTKMEEMFEERMLNMVDNQVDRMLEYIQFDS